MGSAILYPFSPTSDRPSYLEEEKIPPESSTEGFPDARVGGRLHGKSCPRR